MYIIKSSGLFLDGTNGGYNDPGRTHCEEGAKQFKTIVQVDKFIAKTIKLNPHRDFTSDSFEIINQS